MKKCLYLLSNYDVVLLAVCSGKPFLSSLMNCILNASSFKPLPLLLYKHYTFALLRRQQLTQDEVAHQLLRGYSPNKGQVFNSNK